MAAPKERKPVPRIFWWILIALILYVLFTRQVRWR